MKRTIIILSIHIFLIILPAYNPIHAQIWNKVIPNSLSKNSQEALLITPEDVNLMRKDIVYLTSETTKGRQAGTKGEELSGMYIEQRMAGLGLAHIAPKRYRQHFTYKGVGKLSKDCKITLGKHHIFMPEEAIPAPFSAEANEENFVMPESEEANAPWMLALYNNKNEARNQDFNWEEAAYKKAKYAEERGASAVILYDNFNTVKKPAFNFQSEYGKLSIPVIIVFHEGYNKYIKPLRLITPVTIKIAYQKEIHTSANIIGYINNNATHTVVLTAHYDHLGSNGNVFYPGANENASGIAALLAIAGKLKNSQLNKYNYMLVALSAHEYDMEGVKALLKSELFTTKKIAALINLNTVGRLKPNRELFVEGTASSNVWNKLIEATDSKLKLTLSMDLKTKSDEAVAYQNKIPVLLLTTGAFEDKRQVSDLPSKINFKGIEEVCNFTTQLLLQINNGNAPQYANINEAIKRQNEEKARIEAQKLARDNMQKEQEERAKKLAIEKELQNEQARLAARRRDSIEAAGKNHTASNTTNSNQSVNNANAVAKEREERLVKQQDTRDSLVRQREEAQARQKAEREAAVKHRNETLARQKEENEAKKQATLLAAQGKAEKEARLRDLQIRNTQEEGVMVMDSIMNLSDAIGIKIDPRHNQGGVKVGSLLVNYAAQKAGMKKGDIIIQIDNKPIGDRKQYDTITGSLKTDKTIYIKFRREGKLLQLPLKFKLVDAQ